MTTTTIRRDADRTVSDVARESGVAASAVRFYERHGLIHSLRTPGNQRRFDDDAACRVKLARVAQRVGLSIAEIGELLSTLPRDATLEEWQRLHGVLATEGERRIAELRAALDETSCPDASSARCNGVGTDVWAAPSAPIANLTPRPRLTTTTRVVHGMHKCPRSARRSRERAFVTI